MGLRIKPIHDAYREQLRALAPLPPGSTRPPIPPELKAFPQQREDLISAVVKNLNTALGPELASRLEAFLENRIAPNATVQVRLGPGREASRERQRQRAEEEQR